MSTQEDNDEIEKQTISQRFENFLNSYPTAETAIYIDKIRDFDFGQTLFSLIIDFTHIINHDKKLAEELLETPVKTLEKCEAVIEQTYKEVKASNPKSKLNLRITNICDIHKITIRGIRAKNVGKLAIVDGVVTRMTEVKPEIHEAIFECQRCGNVIIVSQIETDFRRPTLCDNPACRKQGPFLLIKEDSRFVDWQSIRLQERPEMLEGGRMPRHVEVLLRDDLVDTVQPGNRVTVIGIVESSQDNIKSKKRTFSTYIDANNIEQMQAEIESIEITPEDEKKIIELSKDPNIVNKLSNSIAPGIYGYETIKKGICYVLFGGTVLKLSDGTRLRGDCNILLIGDPGLGKSQLLRFVIGLVRRGIYTSGKGSSAAGLTAAAIRDEKHGGWALEAGALVLADGGVAGVDEFEKMNHEDRSAIHEIMEQGTVSIAKAGIVATLNARTSIIAAANPKQGRFDINMPIGDQINLPPALISRFDLIFTMKDIPDKINDSKLADHVIDIRQGNKKRIEMAIDRDLLRKYITYAKRIEAPKLTDKGKKLINEFYVNMRQPQNGNDDSPISITVRQLESLLRITEAHAKMRLSDVATEDDVAAAINMMKYCLQNVGIDPETKRLDIDVIMTGTSKSQRDRYAHILEIIEELENQSENHCAAFDDIVQMALKDKLQKRSVLHAIDVLKKSKEIYDVGTNCYRRMKQY